MIRGINFEVNSARITTDSYRVLDEAAEVLKKYPTLRIEVQGHTDNVPIARGPYPSNWELAAARATGVVRWLESQGVDPTRLTGVSYGEFHPVAPNDTVEGRARNRRIEVRLLPMGERSAAPAAAGE